MKKILIKLIKYQIKKEIINQNKIQNNQILYKSYSIMIKNYKDTIMFLEATIVKN